MGYREVKAMRFDKFSVDQRKATSVVTENASLVLPAGSKVYKATTGGTEKIVNIKVEDSAIFHESDQIMFKGVKGYDKEGVSRTLKNSLCFPRIRSLSSRVRPSSSSVTRSQKRMLRLFRLLSCRSLPSSICRSS